MQYKNDWKLLFQVRYVQMKFEGKIRIKLTLFSLKMTL